MFSSHQFFFPSYRYKSIRNSICKWMPYTRLFHTPLNSEQKVVWYCCSGRKGRAPLRVLLMCQIRKLQFLHHSANIPPYSCSSSEKGEKKKSRPRLVWSFSLLFRRLFRRVEFKSRNQTKAGEKEKKGIKSTLLRQIHKTNTYGNSFRVERL